MGLVVYYDRDRHIEQWGKSFILEQRKAYSGYKTKHFIPFISQYYFAKPIPTDEFKSALMESTKRGQYILPIKLDDSNISVEYLHPDTQYLKKQDYTPEQLAGALKFMVDRNQEPAKEVDDLLTDELTLRGPKIIPRTYSKYEEAESLLKYIGEEFEKNLPSLRAIGFVPIIRKNDESVRVMIERDSKTLFVMNVFFSNMGDNHIGYNFNERSMIANSQSENGNIEPIFDKETQKPGYKLNDFTYNSSGDLMSKAEIIEFLWNKMNKQLESRT